jgi:hypothetical protein
MVSVFTGLLLLTIILIMLSMGRKPAPARTKGAEAESSRPATHFRESLGGTLMMAVFALSYLMGVVFAIIALLSRWWR